MHLLPIWNNILLVEKREMRYLEEFDDIDIKELPPAWPLRITENVAFDSTSAPGMRCTYLNTVRVLSHSV